MRKKVLLIIALLCLCASGSWADEVTGSWSDYRDTAWGTDYASASSFTVSTAAQLAQLAYMVNKEHKDFSGKTVTQTDNIDLNGHYWMPIGHYSGDQIFAGTFDGAGKTISGMHIKITDQLYIGLFGHFRYDESSSNKITGVTLANSTIEGKGLVGGIVGENNGLIEDCHVLSDVRIYFSQKSVTNFGGIAGQNYNSSSSEKAAIIRYCSSQVEINNNGFIDEQGKTGSRRCGGIVGYSSTNSSVYGSLDICNSIAGDYSIGAIAGDNDSEHGASLERNYYLTRNVNLKGVGIVDVLVGEDAAGAKPAKKLTFQDDVTITDKEYDGIMKIYSGYHDAFCLLYNGVYYSGTGVGVYLTHASPAAGYSYEFTCSDPTVTSEDYKGMIFFKIGESDCTFGFSTEKAFDGEGTEDSPYLIKFVSDMNKLSKTTNGCLQVNWDDCYFALINDLTFDGSTNNFTPISSCFGSDDLGYKGSEFSYFAGHFDGNGHTIEGLNQEFILSEGWNFGNGIFGRIKNGSVKNLFITNSTFKGYEYYGAVAGELVNGTVENCHVANIVSIQPILGQAIQYVGGIVGYVKTEDYDNDDKKTSLVSGCTVFATIESPTGSNSVQRMGGIAGSVSYSIIKHCLFAGTLEEPNCNYSSVGSLFGGGEATFDGNLYDRNATSVPAVGTNTEVNTLGSDCPGAKAAYILTMNDPVYLGETLGEFIAIDNDEIESYPPCGHINTALSAYDGIIYYNGYYVEPGASITLKTDNPYRASFNVETADMTGNTFTMPAANATAYATNIARREWGGSGTQADPFTISNVAGLNALADEVNSSGLSTLCFTGQYFKLTDDIDYSEVPVFANFSSNFTPIGYFQSNQDMKTFNGNFDGDGHTISGVRVASSASYHPVGIFGMVYNGTVKNLTVEHSKFEKVGGTVIDFGPIAGAVEESASLIQNCHVGDDVMISIDNQHYAQNSGGIVGRMNGGTVKGCTSKAWWQVLDTSYNPDLGITPQPTRFGCIVGSVVNAAISDCLYYNDQQLMLNIYTGGIVTDNQSSTIERSYFTCTPNDGKAWRIDFPDENFTVNEAVEPAYESSKMKTWEQGILFRGSLYLLKDQTATLTCNDTKYLNGNALAEGVEIVSYQEGIQLDGTGASISSPQAKSTCVTMGSTNACVVASCVLDAGADNTAKIASLSAAGSLNVTLRNLNLYADNAWNTICLPFEVELQSSEGKGNIIDCAFQNAIVKELTSSSFADGTLTLNFSEVTDRMQAGKPYLIKWTNSEYYSNRWQNPVFLTPDMSNPNELTSTTINATFTGTFSPVTLMGGDRSVLYIGGGNNLYFPAADRTMNAFRAYFLLNLDASNEVKAFVLNFDEDNADGINSLTFEEDEMINGKSSNGKWYDLSGRKLSGQPSKGGIYIVNGKKVLY